MVKRWVIDISLNQAIIRVFRTDKYILNKNINLMKLRTYKSKYSYVNTLWSN